MTAAIDFTEPWVKFVQANGYRANRYELATVINRTEKEIDLVRRTGTCARLPARRLFVELFTLWHGRAPSDQDWPLPRKREDGYYEWHAPEIVLLASLVGQIGVEEIADVLTIRLRLLTGDQGATRTKFGVLSRMHLIGLQTGDLVGGLSPQDAGREIGSYAIVLHAIEQKELATHRVGGRLVIPYAIWEEWKSKRVAVPNGYTQLSTLRESLGIKSDKLSEYARMGYIPTALRIAPYGVKANSTQFGTWYVTDEQAQSLLQARHDGKPMPWHGKPILDNLKKTYKLWQARRHPEMCEACSQAWGADGAPADFDDYLRRYPSLAHGAKRHLTMAWSAGLTVREVAFQAGRSESHVRRAIQFGVLNAMSLDGREYVSKTDCSRWIARKCPAGESVNSWIPLETAEKLYGFSIDQLNAFITEGVLNTRPAGAGFEPGAFFVGRHQCGQLREKHGYSEEEAAARAGVTVERLRSLLEGVEWRDASGIPLSAVQTVIKRIKSSLGYTIEEAAAELGVNVEWVEARRADGTIRINTTKWDSGRLYVSKPMMKRLEAALQYPQETKRLDADWLLIQEAALEAGVSAATVANWAEAGELERKLWRNIWRYPRAGLRARARIYWKTVRFLRAVPPTWLQEEASTSDSDMPIDAVEHG